MMSKPVETRLLFCLFTITPCSPPHTPKQNKSKQKFISRKKVISMMTFITACMVRTSLTLTRLYRGCTTVGDKGADRSWRSRNLPSLTLSIRESRTGAVDSDLGSLLLFAPSLSEQYSQDLCPRGMRSGRKQLC